MFQAKRNSRREVLGKKKDKPIRDKYINEVKEDLQKYLSSWEEDKYIKIDKPKEYWDSYWKSRISDKDADGKFFYFEITDELVPILRKLHLRKILCVGNGVSLEAPALAYAGFEVDVLDVSQEAIDFLSNYKLTVDDLKKFYSENQHRPGGKINYIIGDFTDKSICPGGYDVIITRRTLQYFTRNDFFGVLNILIEKLNDGGIFINHTHNAYDVGFAIEKYLTIRNFVIYHSLSNTHFPSLPNKRKVAWLFGSSG